MRTTSASRLSIPPAPRSIRGRVIAPDDADYDQARTVMYGGFDPRPAVIVRVADDADVATVIALARETGLELAVRSGGHSNAGHSTTDGGIVLDLRDLTAIDIDVAGPNRLGRRPGLTAAELTPRSTQHGLAVGFGDTGSVGIGGITLGGGVGYLVRKHGLTIDSLLAAEIVTADGEMLRVDADAPPGPVLGDPRRRRQLRRRDEVQVPAATRCRRSSAGMLILPANPATRSPGSWPRPKRRRRSSRRSPTSCRARRCPFVPEELHGQLVIMGCMVLAGDEAAGEARARAVPRARHAARRHGPADPLPGDLPARGRLVPPHRRRADDVHRPASIRTSRDDPRHLEASDASHAGRPAARARRRDGARAGGCHRVRPSVQPDHGQRRRLLRRPPRTRRRARRGSTRSSAALDQGDDGAYVNFLARRGPERVRAAYPGATWDRLAAIKRRYDPDNLFRLNQNIPPATT